LDGSPEATQRKRPDLIWLFLGFSGRIGRQSFVLGFLFLFFPIIFVIIQILKVQGNEGLQTFWGVTFLLVTGALIWPVAALTIKRVHDLGWPVILAILIFVPGAQWFFLSALCVMPSLARTNEHGPPPFRPVNRGD
jgi:uncharacterized membrane protein YhaH (DUF805 family)